MTGPIGCKAEKSVFTGGWCLFKVTITINIGERTTNYHSSAQATSQCTATLVANVPGCTGGKSYSAQCLLQYFMEARFPFGIRGVLYTERSIFLAASRYLNQDNMKQTLVSCQMEVVVQIQLKSADFSAKLQYQTLKTDKIKRNSQYNTILST